MPLPYNAYQRANYNAYQRANAPSARRRMKCFSFQYALYALNLHFSPG